MFNLDEALRHHLAQRQKEPKERFVAVTVATLSPCLKPGKARGGAGVADVATTHKAIASATDIIQWLKEEGAHLYVTDNRLCFRPTDWGQVSIVNAHWQALLLDLAAVDQEQRNGSGR